MWRFLQLLGLPFLFVNKLNVTAFTPHIPSTNTFLPNAIASESISLCPVLRLQTASSNINENTTENKNIFVLFEILDKLYTQSNRDIRCPFFRRRAADLIDGFAMVLRFLMIRHKSLYLDDFETFMIKSTPPGCRSAHNGNSASEKIRGLNIEELHDIILQDWTKSAEISSTGTQHHVGYYITGKLNSAVYRDDCLFTGPDPDMPVHGLRKYLSAASKLFHHKQSFADLLDLNIENNIIIAYWRISGVIMLPWKPRIRPYTGKTEYHIDDDGLIYLHKESWDISVLQAFVSTMWPDIAKKIWLKGDDGMTIPSLIRERS